ncbi:peptidase S9 prolyl oligopeptidase active site domain protein [Glycocaulis alkaliphilus]|uniref:Peptidase S9 prolyl oligopeptidase active site domain protein n=1 Tax=Glycocaulis alkaliphilus TaxID=1434191 RepID=A0A3T0E9C9_9PROT|nr:S9 family peptidase [Glycocaulis alkaliphilus]AZU03981.1 peptidase S9 prolyl oligopeptidase active site domain protein [Glycocaulis alkaliphilus]GGB74834.1 prolyl oligopeptidase [Glycocaulis alkaliphilus]
MLNVRSLAASIVLAAGAFSALPAATMAQERVPAAEFAQLGAISSPTLSPSGSQLAYLSRRDDRAEIRVSNLQTGETISLAANDVRIGGMFWVDEDMLVIRGGIATQLDAVRGVVDFNLLMAFDLRTQEFRRLIRQGRRMAFNPDTSNVRGVDRENRRVLVQVSSNLGTPDLYWADVDTGLASLEIAADANNAGWILNRNFEPVARIDRGSDRRYMTVSLAESRSRFRSLRRPEGAPQITSILGLNADETELLVTVDREGFADTVLSIPLDGSGNETIIYEDTRFEIGGARRDPHSREVIGLVLAEENVSTLWFDEEWESLQTELEAALDADVVTIASWTEDRRSMIISADYNDRPSHFFLLTENVNGQLELSAPMETNPVVAGLELPERRSIEYTARDGTTVQAYITVPDTPGPHPAVVLPHGGPAARDYGGFDLFAHFLADRGFAVIQPNFRGSDGFGYNWRRAGYGEWGLGIMQHDVSDAVAYAIQQGIADSERVCIAGASYGGYAALAGAVYTPELYACAISINGVSDLQGMLNYTASRSIAGGAAVRYWRESMVGSATSADSGYLRARSPAENAARAGAAVLLLHGRDDSVVPINQSERMDSALRSAGHPVTFIAQEGGDHWLTGYQARLQVLEEMERFLFEVLGDPAD